MSSCFPLVFFDDKRNPTIGKVLRDAHQMVSMSKYVIILNKRGEIVSSPTPFDAKKVDPVLECMVIVAPVLYEGVLIPNAVVLEIGFNRFVPYAQTEYKDERQIVRAIKQRARVAGISATVLLGIMPTVLGLVQQEMERYCTTLNGGSPKEAIFTVVRLSSENG